MFDIKAIYAVLGLSENLKLGGYSDIDKETDFTTPLVPINAIRTRVSEVSIKRGDSVGEVKR